MWTLSWIYCIPNCAFDHDFGFFVFSAFEVYWVMSKMVINVYFSCRVLYSRHSGSCIDYCYIEHLLFSCADCFKIVLSCTSLVDFMDLLKSSFAIFRMLYFMSFPYQIKFSFTYKKNIEWNFLCGPSPNFL